MTTHDWRQWTPARIGNTSRWRLIRFDAINAEGKPVGRCIESQSPAGGTRSFAREADAQRVADFLNAEGNADA